MRLERYQLVKSLLAGALDQEKDQRKTWLEQACQGDADLLSEVLGLMEGTEVSSQVFSERAWRPAAPERDLQGVRLGPWRIEQQIGCGGMGSVWLAARDDNTFDMKVAIKIIQKERCFPELIGRFRRERQILATLKHPNIAALLDGGTTTDGRPYLVMEFVDGEAVDRYCNLHKLSWQERIGLIAKLCQAVAYAHGKGVIHRDIKSANVMVTHQGQLKLMDFGIARLEDHHTGGDLAITRTGEILMTPEYAAPEQHHGHQANERTDLYSIGLLLLQLLYGFPPRVRHADAVPQIQELMATSSSRGEPLPEALGGILYQALALDPLQRQVSVQYLQHQLENLLDLDGAPKLQRGMNSVPYTILSPDPVTVTAQGCPTKPIYHLRRNRLRAQRLTRLQRLAREWERQGRLPDYLLRGQPLAQMTKLVAWQDNQTRAEVRLYLEAGHMAEAEAKTREEQQRAEGALTQKTLFRLKWLCLGLGALLIATLIWHFNCK